MRRFIVTTEGSNQLGLRELCQRFCDDRWIASHLTPDQATSAALTSSGAPSGRR